MSRKLVVDVLAYEREREPTLKGANMSAAERAEIEMMEAALESHEFDRISDESWLRKCEDVARMATRVEEAMNQ